MALYDRMHKSQRQATEKVQGKSATATSYRKAQGMSATVKGKLQKGTRYVGYGQRQATEKVQGMSATVRGKPQKRYKVSLLHPETSCRRLGKTTH